jgi:hypothetical protein
MGYHIILDVICDLLPEYINFIKNQYILKNNDDNDDDEDDEVPMDPMYIPFLKIWESLEIGNYFYEYKLEGQRFSFRIEKKPHRHSGNLEEDYIKFMENIIVPISFIVRHCSIEHDDYDLRSTSYTDSELRKTKKLIAFCQNCNTKIYE